MCGTAVGSVGMTVSRPCVVGRAVGSGSMDVRKPCVGGVSVRSVMVGSGDGELQITDDIRQFCRLFGSASYCNHVSMTLSEAFKKKQCFEKMSRKLFI